MSTLTQLHHQATHTESENLFKSLRSDDGGLVIEVRKCDGYVNATKLAQSGGKKWKHYKNLDSTKAFLEELSSSIEKEFRGSVFPTLELVQKNTGGNGERHTFVHRRVALHMAQWISTPFEVQVTGLLERYLAGEVTTEESQHAAAIVENLRSTSEPPPYEKIDVKYQNIPRGPTLYLRRSLCDFVDGYVIPPGTKMLPECIKFGISRTGLDSRDSSYGDDGGIYTHCLTVQTDDDLLRGESAIRSAMRNHTIHNSHEYVNPANLVVNSNTTTPSEVFSNTWKYITNIVKAVLPHQVTGEFRSNINLNNRRSDIRKYFSSSNSNTKRSVMATFERVEEDEDGSMIITVKRQNPEAVHQINERQLTREEVDLQKELMEIEEKRAEADHRRKLEEMETNELLKIRDHERKIERDDREHKRKIEEHIIKSDPNERKKIIKARKLKDMIEEIHSHETMLSNAREALIELLTEHHDIEKKKIILTEEMLDWSGVSQDDIDLSSDKDGNCVISGKMLISLMQNCQNEDMNEFADEIYVAYENVYGTPLETPLIDPIAVWWAERTEHSEHHISSQRLRDDYLKWSGEGRISTYQFNKKLKKIVDVHRSVRTADGTQVGVHNRKFRT